MKIPWKKPKPVEYTVEDAIEPTIAGDETAPDSDSDALSFLSQPEEERPEAGEAEDSADEEILAGVNDRISVSVAGESESVKAGLDGLSAEASRTIEELHRKIEEAAEKAKAEIAASLDARFSEEKAPSEEEPPQED